MITRSVLGPNVAMHVSRHPTVTRANYSSKIDAKVLEVLNEKQAIICQLQSKDRAADGRRLKPTLINRKSSFSALFGSFGIIWSRTWTESESALYKQQVAKLPSHCKLLIDSGETIHADLFFEILTKFGLPQIESAWPIVAKYVQAVKKKDSHGWSLLHWAVLRGCAETVQTLLTRGLNPFEEDSYGISPYKLAVFRLDHSMLSLMKDLPANVQLCHVDLNSYLNIFTCLKKMQDENDHDLFWGCLYDLIYQATPHLLEMNPTSPLEKSLIDLYRPISEQTPLAKAIKEKNLDGMRSLFACGWNYVFEEHFRGKHMYSQGGEGGISGFYELEHLAETPENRLFFEKALQCMHGDQLGIPKDVQEKLQEKLSKWGQPKPPIDWPEFYY